MPRLPGFVGGTYTPRSYRADVERTVNLFPEIIESKEGENIGWLDRRPGLNIPHVVEARPRRRLLTCGRGVGRVRL